MFKLVSEAETGNATVDEGKHIWIDEKTVLRFMREPVLDFVYSLNVDQLYRLNSMLDSLRVDLSDPDGEEGDK